MARRRKRIQDAAPRADFLEVVKGVTAQDAFMNTLSRLGFGQANIMEATQYPLTRLTRDYNLMTSLYRSNWVARRIIETVPKDMLKNWITYQAEIKPEEIDALHKMERLTRVRDTLNRGLCWGRLYGGAGGLIMLDGQEDMLEEPLDLDAVMPGDFKGLLIVDRWSGIFPELGMVSDINDPEFGLPEFYSFRNYTSGAVHKVHHSRIVRFTGAHLPEWERMAEVYWGASIIETVYEEVKKRDNTSANIANLVFFANLRILKMGGLGEMLAGTNNAAQKRFYDTISAQNTLMNNFGLYVMSKEDDFQSIQTSFTGLNEIYECFMMDLSGATQIPVTKLFGRPPAGFNATGENDMRNYYDFIECEQEAHLRPALEKLLPVMAMSTLGHVPDDIDFVFNPLHTPTEEEIAKQVESITNAVLECYNAGLVSQQVALKELKLASDETGLFTNITDDDINKADAEPIEPLPPLSEDTLSEEKPEKPKPEGDGKKAG